MVNELDDPADKQGAPPDIVWKGVGIAAGMLGAVVARSVIKRVRRGKGRPGKVEAVLWTSLVAAGAQLGRAGAQRAVAVAQSRRQPSAA
jgi:hypothetical protein